MRDKKECVSEDDDDNDDEGDGYDENCDQQNVHLRMTLRKMAMIDCNAFRSVTNDPNDDQNYDRINYGDLCVEGSLD